MPETPHFTTISPVSHPSAQELDHWIMSTPGGTWFHTIEAHRAVWNAEPDVLEFADQSGNRQVLYVTRLVERAGMRYPKRHALLYLTSPVGTRGDRSIPDWYSALAWKSGFSLVNWMFPWQDEPYPIPAGGTVRTGLYLPVHPDPDRQIRSFSEQAKRQIRKSVPGHFDWVPARQLSMEELSLLTGSYLAHGRKPPFAPEELFGVLSRIPDGRVTALRYRQSDRTLAWRLWISDPRGWLTDWLSAIDRSNAPEPTGYHLVNHSLEYARLNHYTGLDLGGINTAGIAEFKQRFGGVKRHGLHLLTSPNPLIRLLIRANNLRHQRNRQV